MPEHAPERPARGAVRPVIRPTSRLVDEVHQRILEMISTGVFPPDARLHQEGLAADLGVSRTPVREALLRLEREGVVYSEPGRGMFVKGVTRVEVAELYEARLGVEPFGARLATLRASDKEVADVLALQRRHERRYPRDVARAFRANHALHSRLVRPCRNGLLLRFLDSIWSQDAALRVFAFYPSDPSWVEHMVGEHRQIIDAFAARDADQVEELLRRHIQDSCDLLLTRADEVREAKRTESG